MKFAHLADCHIGGWREKELKKLSIEAFKKAVDLCIQENVGFVLIAGDLFDTALPDISILRQTASALRKLRNKNISVYTIAGSHDYSPSGKTMLSVLEKAGLIKNVARFKANKLQFTTDKTQVKITGLIGKRGSLEKQDYEELAKQHLEAEQGFKIFMFHTTIDEYKPEGMEKVEGQTVNLLPKNFNYYAGGHVHYIFDTNYSTGILAYPGALFPNNFKELEEFKHGGLYIVNHNLEKEWKPIKVREVLTFKFDADNKNPEDLQTEILETILKENILDKILTIRVAGTLKTGKPSDLNLKEVITRLSEDAYIVLKNTNKLTTKEFEEQQTIQAATTEEAEEKIIKDHLGQVELNLEEIKLALEDEEKVTHDLIQALNQEKEEGEKNIDFETRIIKDVLKKLKLEELWNAA